MAKGEPATQTVNQTTTPDPFTQQWRGDLYSKASSLYGQGAPDYYPGQTVVPFSQQTQTGLNMLQTQAQGGAPNLQNANAASARALSGRNPALPQAMNFASGQGMNPYLDSLYAATSSPVMNSVNTQFQQAGRTGSDAHVGAMTRELGKLSSSIYAPAYEAERNRQLQGTELAGSIYDAGQGRALQAQALLPSLYEYGQMPGRTMIDVGGMYEGLQGEQIDDAMTRHFYPHQSQQANLSAYANILNGLPDFSGSTQTTTGRPATNRGMGALGGAMAGAQLGSVIPGLGTGLGAGAGALLGLFR